jgi:GGDEF domain-containing protein
MYQIRVRVILLIFWLAGFISLVKLLQPIEISSLVGPLMVGISLLVLVTSRFSHLPLWLVLAAPLSIFIVLKAWTVGLSGGIQGLVTILECCAIALTALLIHLVSLSIKDFECAVAHITIGQRDKLPETASTGEGYIYREVRRARNHQRPLALMAIALEEHSVKAALDRIVQDAQRTMMKQYVLSAVSKELCDKLEDCDILVQNKDQFFVVLPETKPEDIGRLTERLRQQVLDNVGVELKIGAATLPEDGYTFEGLLRKASEAMEVELESQFFLDVERFSVKEKVN